MLGRKNPDFEVGLCLSEISKPYPNNLILSNIYDYISQV